MTTIFALSTSIFFIEKFLIEDFFVFLQIE